jgi:hypothetical protein
MALERDGPAISVEALALRIHETTGADKDLVQGLVQGLPWLIEISVDEESIRRFGKMLAKLAVDKDDEKSVDLELTSQFSRLLACEASIGTTAKAQNIMWGHGRVYRDAHIVSQIRPLFLTNIKAGARNAVIVHELRIAFQVDGKDESICVAMDLDKIEQLQGVLNRAMSKEHALRQQESSFQYLTTPARRYGYGSDSR